MNHVLITYFIRTLQATGITNCLTNQHDVTMNILSDWVKCDSEENSSCENSVLYWVLPDRKDLAIN